jgi:hypothetical protein
MDSTGARIIVGAWQATVGENANQGAAYVFSRSGTTWTQERKLTSSDGAVGDSFGYSVAIDSTGARIIVGAWQATISGRAGQGAAYVFSRSGTTWTQERKLTASDGAVGNAFGYSVAMDSTGTRVIVGAYSATISGRANQGAAYVFSRSGTTWTQERKLTSSDGVADNYFGISVAMDSTGVRVIVGAYSADISGRNNQGAAYVFSRSGTTWTQEQKLTASDGAADNYFGISVATDSTGTRVIVGAYSATVGENAEQGAVYVYSFTAPFMVPAITVGSSESSTPITINMAGQDVAEYTLTLSQKPTAPVTVDPTSSSRKVRIPAILRFTKANWNIPHVIRVRVRKVNPRKQTPPSDVTITHTAKSKDKFFNNISIPNVILKGIGASVEIEMQAEE